MTLIMNTKPLYGSGGATMRRQFRTLTVLAIASVALSGCGADPEPQRSDTTHDAADAPAVDHETVETDLGEVEILADNLEVLQP